MPRKRAVISVFRETYEMLLREKLKKQGYLQKEITWDDFFTQLVKGR